MCHKTKTVTSGNKYLLISHLGSCSSSGSHARCCVSVGPSLPGTTPAAPLCVDELPVALHPRRPHLPVEVGRQLRTGSRGNVPPPGHFPVPTQHRPLSTDYMLSLEAAHVIGLSDAARSSENTIVLSYTTRTLITKTRERQAARRHPFPSCARRKK